MSEVLRNILHYKLSKQYYYILYIFALIVNALYSYVITVNGGRSMVYHELVNFIFNFTCSYAFANTHTC